MNYKIAIATAAVALVGFVGGASAAPVHTSDTNVTSWNVGSGQINGHFSVTADSAFTGGAIELGLRTEQRSVGAVVPNGDDYTAQAGADPTNAGRAWWNFQLSIAYDNAAGGIGLLDGLTLTIRKDGGTNSGPAGTGVFDLLALRGTIDDRNAPASDANYSDIYQVSQNPLFGWFSPAYDLSANSTFAYLFTLTATEGNDVVSASMCVHTDGLGCGRQQVPEPANFAMLGLGVAALGMLRRRRRGA